MDMEVFTHYYVSFYCLSAYCFVFLSQKPSSQLQLLDGHLLPNTKCY